MSERRTLLSQSDPKIGPISPVDVRPPEGAFGDTRGLSRLGDSLSRAGATGADIAAREANQLHMEGQRRDASDIQARLQLAVNEEAIELSKDYSAAVQAGQSNNALLDTIKDSAQKREKNIPKKLEDIRVRNPQLYDKIVTPDVLRASWYSHVDNVERTALNYSAERNQAERYETAVKSDDILFAAVAASPAGALRAAQMIYEDTERRSDLFTAQQRMQRRASAQANVTQTLLGAASVTPSQDVINQSENARDAGLISPSTHARVIDEVRRNLKPANIAGEVRTVATNMNETIKSGVTVGIDAANATLAAAGETFDTPSARFSEVIKPRALAMMEGKLRNATATGFLIGGTLQTAQSVLTELDKPQSEQIDRLFEQEFRDTLFQLYNAAPGSQKAVEGAVDLHASAQDLANYRTSLRATLQKQMDMVEKFQVHELYENNPGVQAALNTGNTATIVRVQKDLYDRDGIPENRRVYGNPREIQDIAQRMGMTDEASVGTTVQMVDQFVKNYGKDSYGALMSTAQAPGPVSGVVRYMAQQFTALNKDAERGIVSMLPDIVQAVAWNGSQLAKKVDETNPDFKRDTDAYWNAALASGSAADFDSKKAFGLLQDNELHSSPESSPLGSALLRDGTYTGIHELGAALTRYYAAGKKDRILRPNEAAKEAREVIGRAFVPVYSTGAGADRPVYTLGPVTHRQTAWYTPGSKGAFNSERHYAQMEGAAWDSMFLTNDPKFALGGAMQWQFNLALTHAFNGPRVGFNTELAQMPNLDPSFSAVVRQTMTTTAFNSRPIDFANIGIMYSGEEGKSYFTPLSDDRLVTGFFPQDLREKIDQLLKKTDQTDLAGRNQLILANNFQRELNTKTNSWDVYISGGRNYDGTAGTASKVGPRASVVVRQPDGTFKKLSISVADADNRLEALMSASSMFDRSGGNNQVRKELLNEPNTLSKR